MRPYRSRLFEKKIKALPYRRCDKRFSRKEPAIIPFEATVRLQDPRGAPQISFLDVSNLLEEELKSTNSYESTLKTEKLEDTDENQGLLDESESVEDQTTSPEEIMAPVSELEKKIDLKSTLDSSTVNCEDISTSNDIKELHMLLDYLSESIVQSGFTVPSGLEISSGNSGSTSPIQDSASHEKKTLQPDSSNVIPSKTL